MSKNFKYTIVFNIYLIVVFSAFYWYLHKKTDAQKAAIEYCTCLKENNVANERRIAEDFCEAKLVVNYPLYRYYVIDSRWKDYTSVNDSIRKLAHDFYWEVNDYTTKTCCKW